MSSRDLAPWEMSEIRDAPAVARRAAQAVRDLAASALEREARLCSRVSELEGRCDRMDERLLALERRALEAEADGGKG